MHKLVPLFVAVGLLAAACGGMTEPTARAIAERAIHTAVAGWPTQQPTTTPAPTATPVSIPPTSTPAPTATPQVTLAPLPESQLVEALRRVLPATPTPIAFGWIESLVLTAIPPSPIAAKLPPTATAIAAGTSTVSGSTPLELLSVETRKTAETASRWQFGWTAIVRNNTSSAEDFYLYTYLTDADGFAIDYDITGNTMVGAGQTVTVTGIMDIDLPQARNVSRASARISN